MKRIVSIKLNAKESRYWLELEDGSRLGLSPAVYLASGSCLDGLLSEADWQSLERQEAMAQIRSRALALLDYGDRSEAELKKRLPFDPELVDAVVGELRAVHLVDDRRYVERAVDRHLRRGGWGRRKLAYELQRSGVARELVETASEMIDEDEELAAAVVWVRRQLRQRDIEDATTLRRLYQGLLRHGFAHPIAQLAIRSLSNDTKESIECLT